MPRISVPVERDFLSEFDKKVPWGIRNSLVKGLIKIIMETDRNTMYRIAYSDNASEEFKISKN